MTGAAAPVRQDSDGNPYWTFIVSNTHLQSNRRIAFPQDVAEALGCKPDAVTRIAVENPAGCRKLMVLLERRPSARTIILHLAEPLRRLNAAQEQLIDLVVAGPRRVVLRPSTRSMPLTWGARPRNSNSGTPGPTRTAAPARPAPWGSPPTPLLPAWHLDALAAVSLPSDLVTLLDGEAGETQLRSIGDLVGFWESRTEPVGIEARRALSRIVRQQRWPPKDHIVIPSEAEAVHLLECPLGQRATNCVSRAVADRRLKTEQPVTVGWLSSLQNFGIASLLEVMCVTEAAVESGFLTGRPASEPDQPATSPKPSEPPDPSITTWSFAIPLLKRLLAGSAEFYGAHTLTDALTCDLGRIISELHMEDPLNGLLVCDLADGRTFAEEAVSAVTEFWEALSPIERLILEERLLAPEPLSLEEIGRKTSLSRERIRQIQKPLEARLRQSRDVDGDVRYWVSFVGATIRHHVGPIVAERDLEERITRAFPDVETAEADKSVMPIARQLLRRELGYACHGGVCFDDAASEVVKGLKDSARCIADDTGLIDERDLRARLPEETWQQHWAVLLARCGLLRLSGRLALRDTAKARARAALISIGRPATKEEVAQQSGLDSARAGAQLSAMDGVVRADKNRWGLAEWIDDEYEGIAAEIVQRIEEDGGATRLERLLEELPRMFEVSENIVRSYIATPKFSLKDGYVSAADSSSIRLRSLADAVHGHTVDGRPYWQFRVEDRYFDGYSLTGLPPEIVKALGCEPDGRVRVPISEPTDCKPISVSWPLASNAGANIGYLSEPLRRLGARGGERALFVIDSPESVSIRLETPVIDEEATKEVDAASFERGHDFLERMKNRRRAL